jgi:hypothetical protein
VKKEAKLPATAVTTKIAHASRATSTILPPAVRGFVIADEIVSYHLCHMGLYGRLGYDKPIGNAGIRHAHHCRHRTPAPSGARSCENAGRPVTCVIIGRRRQVTDQPPYSAPTCPGTTDRRI